MSIWVEYTLYTLICPYTYKYPLSSFLIHIFGVTCLHALWFSDEYSVRKFLFYPDPQHALILTFARMLLEQKLHERRNYLMFLETSFL